MSRVRNNYKFSLISGPYSFWEQCVVIFLKSLTPEPNQLEQCGRPLLKTMLLFCLGAQGHGAYFARCVIMIIT